MEISEAREYAKFLIQRTGIEEFLEDCRDVLEFFETDNPSVSLASFLNWIYLIMIPIPK